jgi:ABC-type transport system substrate-binding protein
LGIKLYISYFSEDFLANSIIRNRDFDILLFGYQTNIHPDLYYFFHSSQIDDPGINISGINNNELDKHILKLRTEISDEDTSITYQKINKLILQDYSFIPIYSPFFVYTMDSRVNNFKKTIINSREERFSNISD